MPIMAPLASFVNVPEQLVVTAYQSASGLMNLFIPTSAVVMEACDRARALRPLPPLGWPLLAILAVLCIVVIGVGAALQRAGRGCRQGGS